MKKLFAISALFSAFLLIGSNAVYSQQGNKDTNPFNTSANTATNEMLAGGYTFSYSTGTYTELKGSTNLSVGVPWDYASFNCVIGFTFKFFDLPYDSFIVSDPNYLQFGENMGDYFISAYGSDLADQAFGDGTGKPKSPISYLLVDTAPNRILKIEWKNARYLREMADSNTFSNYINLQLWLYETSNNIEIHFGPSLVTYKHLAYESCPGFEGPNISLNNNVNSKYLCLIGDSTSPKTSTLPEQYMKGTPPNGSIYKFDAGYVNGISSRTKGIYSFYPNPVRDVARISMPEKMEWADVRIFNQMGKEMLSGHFTNTDFINLDVKSLPQGIYILKLQNSETTATHKFTKQ